MKKYSTSLLLGIILTLLITASFNWLVNPLDMFSTPIIHGFNAHKADADRYDRLIKPYKIKQIKPTAIILGSSRALYIPVDHPTLSNHITFNASLASSSIYELRRMYQHTLATSPLKKVIIGLEEELLNGTVEKNFDENRLHVNNDNSSNNNRYMAFVKDTFTSLLSAKVTRTSISTISKQPEGDLGEFKNNYLHERIKKLGGHRQLFRVLENSTFPNKLSNIRTCQNTKASSIAITTINKDLEYIINNAYQNNIELLLFFSHVHARYLEGECLTGKWTDIENLKRATLFLSNTLAKKYNTKPFPVWDFSDYNSITTEDIPPLGDTETRMQWYIEGSHYSEATAALILDRIAGNPIPHNDFGVLLTVKKIESHLDSIHTQRQIYVKNHPYDIKEIGELSNH